MLVEIRCDKFMSKGQPRGSTVFHAGLNTVLGAKDATNSIGKSTFLQIIDFAFGGDTYTSSDAKEHVGEHAIEFAFEFDGNRLFFSRSIGTPRVVNVCNDRYFPEKQISLDEFRAVLFDSYQIKLQDLLFRDIVGRYFRIHGKKNFEATKPLLAASRQSDKKGIASLLKLFGEYGVFKQQTEKHDDKVKRREAYTAAQIFGYVPNITTKAKFKENAIQIEQLSAELKALTDHEDRQLSIEELLHADQAAQIKAELTRLRHYRGRLVSQLEIVQSNMKNGIVPPAADLQDLCALFPGVDARKISEVEAFHKRINGILGAELEEESQRLGILIENVNNEIDALTDALRKSGVPVDLSRSFLDKYTRLNTEIQMLERQNNAYAKRNEIKDEESAAKRELEAVEKRELSTISEIINKQMAIHNHEIYPDGRHAPIIKFDSLSKYDFRTPSDRGTGTEYKGLIVFDLSMLDLTRLPAIAHDSPILKNIGDPPVEKILKLYLQTDKQVFIALDKDEAYSDLASSILQETAVLHLSPDDNQLFDRSWSMD